LKQETKEIIRWIKERLNYSCVKGTTDEDKLTKAIKFLDSLPKLEARLGKGGYIPDRNGTPCKDGDVIDIVTKGTSRFESFLFWDDKQKRFYLQPTNPCCYPYSFYEVSFFEKVKDGSNNN
jgi:hypothetical protein